MKIYLPLQLNPTPRSVTSAACYSYTLSQTQTEERRKFMETKAYRIFLKKRRRHIQQKGNSEKGKEEK